MDTINLPKHDSLEIDALRISSQTLFSPNSNAILTKLTSSVKDVFEAIKFHIALEKDSIKAIKEKEVKIILFSFFYLA